MISEEEILKRRDMREAFTFTIDPASAKDFDDAISFVEVDDAHYQIGVHIADVTYYVEQDSLTDKLAYEKATSTYLVDRVIPMLPEELSNDLCSLRPGEDKLCMSIVFTMTHDARVEKYKVCRTVINSDYRLSYEEAQQIIDGEMPTLADMPVGTVVCNNLKRAIKELNLMALIMRRQRMAKGALDIEQEELHFSLGETGCPVDVWFQKPTAANHLIEEWMLLANRTIATHIAKMGKPMVYRVHDKPDEEKLVSLRKFKRRMGDKIPYATIDMLTIRAMAKAEYSTINIGHYGLQFKYYTHFTSPIRRYPDMIVHRLVTQYILGGRVKKNGLDVELAEACEHCSACEQIAVQAERDSQKEFFCLFLQQHIGEVHQGVITGVTEFGLFVQLKDSHAEGLVPIRTISPNMYLQLDEKNYCLRTKASNTKNKRHRGWVSEVEQVDQEKTYMLGDEVSVRIERADADRMQIDFALMEDA